MQLERTSMRVFQLYGCVVTSQDMVEHTDPEKTFDKVHPILMFLFWLLTVVHQYYFSVFISNIIQVKALSELHSHMKTSIEIKAYICTQKVKYLNETLESIIATFNEGFDQYPSSKFLDHGVNPSSHCPMNLCPPGNPNVTVVSFCFLNLELTKSIPVIYALFVEVNGRHINVWSLYVVFDMRENKFVSERYFCFFNRQIIMHIQSIIGQFFTRI